jgi:glycosyltransferase involved in cell wall biosynthesis
LAERDRRVTVTGTVPNVLAELQNADLFVAPMRNSAGIKIKLLQAMAVGLPILATPECATAFGSPPPGMLVAETPEQFARSIERLLSSSDQRLAQGLAGREFVLNGWSWSTRTQMLLEFLARVGESK